MSGKRGVGRAHAPDVQIMNFGDARHTGEVGTHAFDLDALRHRLQRQSHRISEQTPGAGDNHHTYDEARDGVEP